MATRRNYSGTVRKIEVRIMSNVVKFSATLAAAVLTLSTTSSVAGAASMGKQVNWTLPSALRTTDPSNVADIPSQDAVMATGEGLYRVGKSGKPELAAAKSVEESADGLTWTFKLRDNLKWSDGSKVTAADFVYSWRRANDPKTAAIGAMFFTGMKNATAIQNGEVAADQLGAEAVDETTLKVTLENPLPQFKSELAMMYFFPEKESFVTEKGSNFGTSSENSLSSGPYVVTGWDGTSSTYTLEKNKYYWDAGKVRTPKVKVTATPSATTAMNLYEAGDSDWVTLNATQAKSKKNDKGYKVVNTAATTYLELNPNKQNLDNLKLRQALQYAVNRKDLSTVLYGAASPAKTFTAQGLATDPNTGKDFTKGTATKYVAYKPSDAKKLWKEGLKEVGKSSMTLTLLTNDTDASKKTGEALQAQFEKALPGLTVSVKSVPAKQTSSLLKSGDFELAVSTWNADYADPVDMLQTLVTGASWNLTQWSNKEYDALYQKATTTDANDNKARYKDLADLEKMAQKQVAVSPLTYAKVTALQNPKVSGVYVNPVGGTFDFKLAYKK
jgi:oligopeptide transport system substrate-binding protein